MTEDQANEMRRLFWWTQSTLVAIAVVAICLFATSLVHRAREVADSKSSFDKIEAHLRFIDKQNARSIEDRANLHKQLREVPK